MIVRNNKMVKTESSSFRLNKEIFEDFKKHAKDQGVTTNALLNKLMRQYIKWGVVATSMQFIPFPSPIIVELLNNCNEEQIKKTAGEHVQKHFVENLLLMENEESVKAYLEMVHYWCEAEGFSYSTKEKNGIVNFIVRHNLGNNFSIFLTELIKCEIEELTKKRGEVKKMTNTVSFWI